MPLIRTPGFAHVRLTVTNITRSKPFYDRVLGWPVIIDRSGRAGERGVRDSPEMLYGGTVYQAPGGARFGLRPVAPAGQRFDPGHTGLDHLSFRVAAREDLVAARDHLDTAGIRHGEVTDLQHAGISILSFQDPDDINIELTASLG